MCDALAAIAERSAPPEPAGAFATVLGWDAVLYVAGDIEAPAVALPRSLVGGTVVVTVLYLLLSQRLRQWSVAFSPVDFAGTGAMDGRRVPEVAAALS